ncbi:helix-turn-helix domain-containing protein [Streptomyces sp. NPDC005195]|uniref:TetR/AcrR family transcriptional regulator n=1 Tax=Streptomyces sp. NPDC005195 TaxID=3154561 RepID=UPI0033AC4E82
MGMLDDGGTTVQAGAEAASSAETILDAAEKLMADHGYAATSISAICRASGLPVGSLYHHFGSKAGILAAVMERGTVRFYASLAGLVRENASPEQRLQQYYAHAPGLLLDNIPYFKILHASLAGSDAEVLERVFASNEHVAVRLAAAIEPVAQRAGAPDPAGLAIRLARFSATYAGGAMLSSGYQRTRLHREMAPLHGMVLMVIEAAAAGASDRS